MITDICDLTNRESFKRAGPARQAELIRSLVLRAVRYGVTMAREGDPDSPGLIAMKVIHAGGGR